MSLTHAVRGAALVAACLLPITSASAAGGTGDPASPGSPSSRGPVVVIPDCRIVNDGCDLDSESPLLKAPACAFELADLMQRRGISSRQIGATTDVCVSAPGSVAVIGTIHATCPGEKGNRTSLKQTLRTRLDVSVEILDCATGRTAARGRSERAVHAGRRRMLRDAVEELSHRDPVHRIRASHPETPLGWMRADVGGEYSVELRGGGVATGGSGINDYFKGWGIPPDDTASRETAEIAYHPWRAQRVRFAAALDGMQISTTGNGTTTRIAADLRALGADFSVSYGIDYTRHQRLSLTGSFGYYVMGGGLAPSHIRIQGANAQSIDMIDAAFGYGAEARWEWRFTPHFGVSAAYGSNLLNFRTPRQIYPKAFRNDAGSLPGNVEFSGRTARIGIAIRY